MAEDMSDTRSIGVFDSGVGGLTVLNAIRSLLPHENLLYLGDTARVPYGTKSSDSVVKYACQAAAVLVSHDVKALVIACNTASASALPVLCEQYPNIPVIGVIEPGAKASVLASVNQHIGVIATEGTIQNGAYSRAIRRALPNAKVSSLSCSLFVALAEEGWREGSLVESIVAECLSDLVDAPALDTLVLGCTHFPVLKKPIQKVMGNGVCLVDSAETTAVELEASLMRVGLLNLELDRKGSLSFMVTDGVERFTRVAKFFIDEPVSAADVKLIDV